jgi:adenylate kinase
MYNHDIKVNFPEVNPAFDTYRVGTILEMVRQIVLTLTIQEGKRVRVCIQQSMGLGIFTGF